MKSVLVSLLLAASVVGCRVSLDVETKTHRYERADGDVTAQAEEDFAPGDKIKVVGTGINVQGINFTSQGGITVKTDAAATKISVKARVVGIGYGNEAEADDAAKANGEIAASVAVKKNGNTWEVTCGQVTHGDVDAGCEELTVTIPAPGEDEANDLVVESGPGAVRVEVDAVSNLKIDANVGDVLAFANPIQGSTLSVKSGNGKAVLRSTANASADRVTIKGPEDEANGSDFEGATFDGAPFSIGTAGEGASSIHVESEFGGEAALRKR